MKAIKIGLVFTISIVALFFMFSTVNVAAHIGCGCFEGIPTVTLRIPGIEKAHHGHSGNITIGIEDIDKFRGSVGPGVALGYRACQIALSRLYPGEIPPRGDQFVISGSTKPCPVYAISYITGALYGKGSSGILNGNLAFDKSIGEFCFIFARMSDGKAIKLTKTFKFPEDFMELRSKLKDKGTTPEEKKNCFKRFRSLSLEILTIPEGDVFEVTTLRDFSWKKYKEKYLK